MLEPHELGVHRALVARDQKRLIGVCLALGLGLLDLDPEDRERDVLIGLLRRMHENLPAVETATEHYLSRHHPAARRRTALTKDST